MGPLVSPMSASQVWGFSLSATQQSWLLRLLLLLCYQAAESGSFWNILSAMDRTRAERNAMSHQLIITKIEQHE